MTDCEATAAGVLPAETREALRGLLRTQSVPYLEVGLEDGPAICVTSSFREFQRWASVEAQERTSSQPRVPAGYTVGRRRLLPTQPLRQYQEAGTQTAKLPAASKVAADIESAPEHAVSRLFSDTDSDRPITQRRTKARRINLGRGLPARQSRDPPKCTAGAADKH